MRKLALVIALCTVASGVATARGKTEFYTFVDTVIFRDAPGDRVHSENPGVTSTYTNGVGAAVIRIVYAASGDLALELNGTRPQRTMIAETTPANLLAVLGSPYATTATPLRPRADRTVRPMFAFEVRNRDLSAPTQIPWFTFIPLLQRAGAHGSPRGAAWPRCARRSR